MLEYGAYEAKTHFSQLLDRVEAGETILIKRHGKVVAEMNAPAPAKKRKKELPISEQLAAIRARGKLGKPSAVEIVRQMRDERTVYKG